MSDPESFLSRWSRRKREVKETEAPNLPAAADEAAEDDRAAGKVSPNPAPAAVEAALDPTALPSIESITAKTDIRAFLTADVPADLARAALRRAWSSDPAIRDFVGLSENSWDFNAPDGIPGFGPIDAADVERLVAQAVGTPERAPPVGNASAPAALAQADQSPPSESGRTAAAGDEPATPEQESLAQAQGEASEELMRRTNADVALRHSPGQGRRRHDVPKAQPRRRAPGIAVAP
jgi:hypothetical protein